MTSLSDWINANFLSTEPRAFKQKQLWMWGPPDTRKTSLVHKLMRYFRFYLVPHEDFDDLYDDDSYDAAFLDEFSPTCRKTTWLSRFAQGDQMILRFKGRQGMKSKNMPFIVASNFPIATCFTPSEREVIEARFLEVKIQTPLPLDQLEIESVAI